MRVLYFLIGLIVGGVASCVTVLLVGRRLQQSRDDSGQKVVFTGLGEAYWQSEDGLCKAGILEDGNPDFDNAVVIDMMEVPVEELPMLLDIISYLK